MNEHVITVESTQIYRGQADADMAEFLTDDGEGFSQALQKPTNRESVPLDFHSEIKRTYECSCGRRFRKGKTARDHLESASPTTGTDDD